MDQGRTNNRDRASSQPVVGDLPQWNSRFSFSSQRQQAQPSSSTEGGLRRTPGLGQPRRVPLAAKPGAAGAADNRQAPAAAGGGRQPAGKATRGTPTEPNKTPTLCLFERFESLSLNSTPATTAAAAAGGGKHNNSSSAARPAPADSGDSNASADSTTGAADSSAQSGWQQQRRRPARHSVAFGTPSVLTYTLAAAGSTPAGAGAPSAGAERGDEMPLWSNAGHTPYSLPGSSHHASHAGGIRELPDGADSDDDDSDTADTAAAPGGMQLLTSVIHELPAAEAEHTPLAAVRCPRPPATGGEAAAGLLTPASLHGSKRTGVGAARGSSAAAGARAATDISPPRSGSSFSGFRGAAAAAAVGGGGTTPAASTPAGSVSSGSITPTLFGQSKRRTSGGSSGMRMAREPAGSAAAAAASDSGSPASASSGGGAGGSFLGTAASADGAVGGSTSDATSGGWAATPLLGMRLPPVTPKTKLRQPERVATAAKAHTAVPHELRQLLGGSSADMAPGQGVLGSCATLSPVRARRTVQQALDAGEQVLTPVRRSARKHPTTAGAVGRFATPGRPAAAAVQPMLEATNFCYNPNDAMQ